VCCFDENCPRAPLFNLSFVNPVLAAKINTRKVWSPSFLLPTLAKLENGIVLLRAFHRYTQSPIADFTGVPNPNF
jgi:hypothetical protein